MKKRILILLYFLSSLSAVAELKNRGRLDYAHGEFEWAIPATILIGLLGLFSYFFLKEYWHKYKKNILSAIVVSLKAGLLLFIFYYSFNSYFLTNSDNCEISSISIENKKENNAQSESQQLPDGFVPVTQDDFSNITSNSYSGADSWSGYPLSCPEKS